jgi:hypothetical protein
MIYRNSTISIPVSLGLSGLTPSGYVSINGAAFAQITSGITEISKGWYKVTLTAVETSGDVVGLHVEATGVDSFATTIITENDWTAARAAYLDAAISSISVSGGTGPTSTQIAAAVWDKDIDTDYMMAPFNRAGWLFKNLITNTNTLTANYTTIRAAKLDNLDVAVSSRLATSAYSPGGSGVIAGSVNVSSFTNGAITTAAFTAGAINSTVAPTLDANITSRASSSIVSTIATNLDTTISSRMATFSYTAPDNTSIAAIKVDTDALTGRLTAARAGYLDKLNITSIEAAVWGATLDSDVAPYTGNQAGAHIYHLGSRYTKLDNIDIEVSSRLATSAYTSGSTSSTTVAASDIRIELDSNSNSLNQLIAYGESNLAYAQILEARVTSGRVANLDNLDTTVSSRLATSAYTSGSGVFTGSVNVSSFTNGAITTAAFTAGAVNGTVAPSLDANISSRAPSTLTIAAITQDVWSEAIDDIAYPVGQAGYMVYTGFNKVNTNLDATITSRLASATYTAPDNASILYIKAETDALTGRLTATRAGYLDRLDANISSRAPSTLTDTTITDAVWGEVISGYDAPTAGWVLSTSKSSITTLAGVVDDIGVETATLTGRLTDTRAGYLDRLDANITSRAPSSLTVDAITADLWGEDVNSLAFPISTAGYYLYNAYNTVNTNLNATITSRASSSIVDTITTNLDTTISSRLATSAYTTDTLTASAIRIELDANSNSLNQLIAYGESNLAYSQILDARITSGRVSNLDYLDIAVSSRLATSAYTPGSGTFTGSVNVSSFTNGAITTNAFTAGAITATVAPTLDANISSRLSSSYEAIVDTINTKTSALSSIGNRVVATLNGELVGTTGTAEITGSVNLTPEALLDIWEVGYAAFTDTNSIGNYIVDKLGSSRSGNVSSISRLTIRNR